MCDSLPTYSAELLLTPAQVGDQCFSGSLCKQGEAECVVIGTGANTFFGRAATLVGADDDSTGHLQKILAKIGLFCMVSIAFWIVRASSNLNAPLTKQSRSSSSTRPIATRTAAASTTF